MSLKGMPPLLSSSSSSHLTAATSTMMTNDGEPDNGSSGTMGKEERSVTAAAATSRSTTSQSMTSAGQSVWTIGEGGSVSVYFSFLLNTHLDIPLMTTTLLLPISYVLYLTVSHTTLLCPVSCVCCSTGPGADREIITLCMLASNTTGSFSGYVHIKTR